MQNSSKFSIEFKIHYRCYDTAEFLLVLASIPALGKWKNEKNFLYSTPVL